MSYNPVNFVGHKHCGSEDGFSLSRGLAIQHDQRVELLFGCKPLTISQHPAKFGDRRHCGSEDIMVLVCHVILQGHVIKASNDCMGRRSSRQVTILPSLVALGILVVDI